nr:hypothetical protein Iba_chr13eCG0150 [Ipomoea batatas]
MVSDESPKDEELATKSENPEETELGSNSAAVDETPPSLPYGTSTPAPTVTVAFSDADELRRTLVKGRSKNLLSRDFDTDLVESPRIDDDRESIG